MRQKKKGEEEEEEEEEEEKNADEAIDYSQMPLEPRTLMIMNSRFTLD